MTIADFLDLSIKCPINIDKLEAFERFYGVSFSDEAEGYFCALPDGEFLTVDSGKFAHVLDSETILFSNELISHDFSKNNIIPLIDISDGIYVCYIGADQMWGCYSIADRAVFCKRFSLVEVIDEILA